MKNRSRYDFSHLHPPKLPPSAEVWQLKEQGVPVPVIAERYGVGTGTVYNSLARYRIKNGLERLPVLRNKPLARAGG